MRAKMTTMVCDAVTPWPLVPKRVPSHSAPVVTLLRRSHTDRYIIKKIWLNTGQSHGIQILFMPYTNASVTIHMVPEISNISDALDMPSIYQGNFLPPSR